MAEWIDLPWQPSELSGVPRRDRRSGTYEAYLPDPLESRPVVLDPQLSRRVARVEKEVRRLSAGPSADSLAAISRFLLRSEAIASSQIEGVAPSARQVALAELGQEEAVRGISTQARLVANNITVVQRATRELVDVEELEPDHVVALHDALLPDDPHPGMRAVQNWIGGSDWHPIGAQFVPPPHPEVSRLMDDLIDYANGAAHSPLVQAALVHAQFETIHPFTDGNGRVGRALIHTVLTRRGLAQGSVLPVSLVLATLRDTYVFGLNAYRYTGGPESAAGIAGVAEWISVFVEACAVAAHQARSLADDIDALRADWAERVATLRRGRGVRQTPRADSATARLLRLLPEAPVLTARTAERILRASFVSANAALDELQAAGVLVTRKIERNTTAYLASEILDLVTFAERRLASTKFDPALSSPNRPVAAPPIR